MLTLAIVIAAAGAGQQAEAQESEDGLGEYGREGPITRDQVPSGVSEATLSAVNSNAEFAKTRAEWDQSIDFVTQAEQQFSYRDAFGYMSTDPAHIAITMRGGDGTDFDEGVQLWFTDAELAEKERREAVNDAMDEVEALFVDPSATLPGGVDAEVAYIDAFGGIRQDHEDGGKVKLHLVEGFDPSADIHSLMPSDSDIEIIYQTIGYNALQTHLELMFDRLASISATALGGIELSDSGPTILLNLDAEFEDAIPEVIAGVPDELVRVQIAEDVVSDISNPGLPHSASLQKPGLAIHVDGNATSQGCTWGVNANTSSYYYGVTAAHCFRKAFAGTPAIGPSSFAGWINSSSYTLEIYQEEDPGASGISLTAGDTYVVYNWQDERDGGRFETTYADDNCYHNILDSCWQIIRRATLDSVDIGDGSCASLGFTGIYRCGDVENDSYNLVRSGVEYTRLLQVDFISGGGDSGAGLIDGSSLHALDGLVIIADNQGHTYANQAWDTLQALGTGANFNCNLSGNHGTVCPVISR
jgi:hypothetical protein